MHELFAGTADCYRRFRPPYPVETFDWIIAQHGLNGMGRLLDCGCGTGGVFLGLARWFSHTIAIDPDDTMLATARLTAMENRIEATHVPARQGRGRSGFNSAVAHGDLWCIVSLDRPHHGSAASR